MKHLFASCLAFFVALLLAGPVAAQSMHSLELLKGEDVGIIPRYLLQDPNGRAVTEQDFRGRFQLIAFGYTYCPDICPTALTATAAALKSMTEAERARVATLFISVDPERDTPAHLKEYAAFFDPSIVGITGSAEQIAAVARQYGVFYAKQKTDTAGGYVVDHTSETYVVGPDGKLASRLPHGAAPERVAAEVRRLLQ